MIDTTSSGVLRLVLRRRCWIAAIAVAVLLLLALQQDGAIAQMPAFNRDVIALDPAHGGIDGGVKITDSLDEKDVTLEVATRLRSLLMARGFRVVSTRDGTEGAGLANDQRAEIANKAHAVACLVIHATASGNGVQIGASTIGSPLAAIPETKPAQQTTGALSWDRAQEPYVPQSLHLANNVGAALARSNVPIAIGRVAMRPLDNLMCPAISIELAPKLNAGGDPTPLSDSIYQQRVADAVVGALVFWRNQAQPPETITIPKPDARLNRPTHGALEEASRGSGT